MCAPPPFLTALSKWNSELPQRKPPCPGWAPSPCSSHLAIARKANSTFMPVLALVSMKGTPYSCRRRGGVLRAGPRCSSLHPALAPPVATHPGQRLPVLRPDHSFTAHIRLSSRYGSLWGKAALTPTGPAFARGAGAACPLLVAKGTESRCLRLRGDFCFLSFSGCVAQPSRHPPHAQAPGGWWMTQPHRAGCNCG